MKRRRVFKVLLRVSIGLGVLALLVVGIGMLPGKIEGAYQDLGQQCMCDSVNFMQFRDGKVILYRSNHPPANLIGRYVSSADGSVSVYLSSNREGEPETFLLTASPRLWATKFFGMDGDKVEWHRKKAVSGIMATTIRDHEIVSIMIQDDRSVLKTFYDSDLKEIRVETIPPKSRDDAR